MGRNNTDKSLQQTKQPLAQRVKKEVQRSWPMYVMLLPAIILALIFCYAPMGGLVMAFQNYKPWLGITGSEFVGLDNFKQIFEFKESYQAIINTFIIAVSKMVLGLIFPIIVALLLNEVHNMGVKKGIQTLVYLPHFLSWVTVAGMLRDILGMDGIVNMFLQKVFGMDPIFFLGNAGMFRQIVVISDLWKGFGFGMIVYLAAISNIDQSLYEAAQIDGAGRWKQTLSGFSGGGTLCLFGDEESLFPVDSEGMQIQNKMKELTVEPGMQEIHVKRGHYQIVTSGIARNGISLVTYYPLSKMLLPVNNMTYITGGLLSVALLLGALYLGMYNRNILLQLNMLTYKLKRVEDGDLTTQITELPDNEFYYVFDQFNHMIVRMNELFDETLKEQELRMQAELEQLQLQINPHFLYNSLSYIVTVAEQPDAVRSMAVHLSRYYRYCTQKKMITTIKEEVSYAKSYLEIMAMRKRIRYTIEMPKEIGELPIIPLILEPLIENAIEHGLEGCESAKQIEIEIDWTKNGAVSFAISDDGEGMTKEQVSALKERISRKERKEEESVGLWNVNQRLINYYSKSAALGFKRSRWGGLTVYFMIRPEKKKEEESDASIDCR